MIRIDFRKPIDTTTADWNIAYNTLVDIQKSHGYGPLTEKQTIERFRNTYNDEEVVYTWLNMNFSDIFNRYDPEAGFIRIAQTDDDYKLLTQLVPDLIASDGHTYEVKTKSTIRSDATYTGYKNYFRFNMKDSFHGADDVLVIDKHRTTIYLLDLKSERIVDDKYRDYKYAKAWTIGKNVLEKSKERFIKC